MIINRLIITQYSVVGLIYIPSIIRTCISQCILTIWSSYISSVKRLTFVHPYIPHCIHLQIQPLCNINLQRCTKRCSVILMPPVVTVCSCSHISVLIVINNFDYRTIQIVTFKSGRSSHHNTKKVSIIINHVGRGVRLREINKPRSSQPLFNLIITIQIK